jgi:endonuclease/exonuclease/phosphatase family metal-dependent hydrolase
VAGLSRIGIGQDGRVTSLRLLCYNIRSMRDDVDALAREMRDIAPDVAIIQEAPRFLRWRSKCAALARRAGMVQVAGGRAAGANLILSSLAVDVVETREAAFSADPNLHRRGAALARLKLGPSEFGVAGTHLDLVEAPRMRHLDELSNIAAELIPAHLPLIVGGDINAVPGSATWNSLARFGNDAWAAAGNAGGGAHSDGFSYPSHGPVRRIDAVFLDPRIKPLHAEVRDSPDVRIASDHRPLVVELDLPETAAG